MSTDELSLDELPSGAGIELELKDGTIVAGTFDRIEDGVVHLSDNDVEVSAEDVGEVALVVRSEGPE